MKRAWLLLLILALPALAQVTDHGQVTAVQSCVGAGCRFIAACKFDPADVTPEFAVCNSTGLVFDISGGLITLSSAGVVRVIIESSGASNADLRLLNTTNNWTIRNVGSTGRFSIQDTSAGFVPFQIEATAPSNAIFVDSTGKVGIGTSSPNERLTIEGGVVSQKEITTPIATPNYGKTYWKTDNRFYGQDGSGVEHVFTIDYGGIGVVDNTTETAIATAGVLVQVTVFDTNEVSKGMTPDHTTDDVTIDLTADYNIVVDASINSVSGAGSRLEILVQKNNGASGVGTCHQNHDFAGGGGETATLAVECLALLTATDTVELWVENETNTQNYVLEDITMSIILLDI